MKAKVFRLPALLVAGLCLVLAARSLLISQGHPYPLFDEVSSLDLARAAAERGTGGTIACYLKGECLEDNRHPLPTLLIAPLINGTPVEFARAKIASLPWMLGLVVLLGLVSLPAAALLAFSPAAAVFAQTVSADALFAFLYTAALAVLLRWRKKRRGFLAFGLLAGLAYLAKGNGHFLLLSGLAVWALEDKKRDWRPLAAMAAGFALGGSFLLWRNLLVWGDPFHHLNQKVIWLDDWADNFRWYGTAKWDAVGPLWYWRSHTLAEMLHRFAAGAAAMGAQSLRAAAVGPIGGIWPSVTGAAVLGAATHGMWRSWKEGEKAEVAAVLAPAIPLFLAFCWFHQASSSALRYLVPLIAPMLVFVRPPLHRLWRSPSPYGRGFLAAACVGGLFVFRGGIAASPLKAWGQPEGWHRVALYLRSAGGLDGYLSDHRSPFSEWELGQTRRKLYPLDADAPEIEEFIRRNGLKVILVDTFVVAPKNLDGSPPGPLPANGRGSFLKRRLCFDDGQKPPRLLVFADRC